MKLELTKRKSIDEIIEEYYDTGSDERTNRTPKIITRRDFFKISAVSSSILAFPFLTEEAEAAAPLLFWGALALLGGGAYASGEDIEWEFRVTNRSKRPKKPKIDFKLKKRVNLDTMDSMSKRFEIPERTMDIYTASGLSAEVQQDTEAFISTLSRRKEQRTDYFNINASSIFSSLKEELQSAAANPMRDMISLAPRNFK